METIEKSLGVLIPQSLVGYKLYYFVQSLVKNNTNLSFTQKDLKDNYGIDISLPAMRAMLKSDFVKKELIRKLENIGLDTKLTRDEWIRQTVEFRDGEKRLDKTGCFMHKLLGIAKGFLGDGVKTTKIEKQQILFVQRE